MNNLYGVKNIRTGEIEHKSLTSKEVENVIGIQSHLVSKYAATGSTFRNRYVVFISGKSGGRLNSWCEDFDLTRKEILRGLRRKRRY